MFERIPLPCPLPIPFTGIQYTLYSWMKEFGENPEILSEKMEDIYGFLDLMLQDDEYYLVALKVEDQIQASITRAIFDAEEKAQAGASFLIEKYNSLNDPLLYKSGSRQDEMRKDISNYLKNKTLSPAMKLVSDLFPTDFDPSSRDSFGYAMRLKSKLDRGTFLLERFFPFYLQHELGFSQHKDIVKRQVAISFLNRKREISSIKKVLMQQPKFLVSFNELIDESLSDVSWLSDKDVHVIHAIGKGEWQPGELKKAGLDINQVMNKSANYILGKNASQKAKDNFVAAYHSLNQDLSDDVTNKAIQALITCIDTTARSQSNNKKTEPIIKSLLSDNSIHDDLKIGACIHNYLNGNGLVRLNLSDHGKKRIPKVITHIIQNPSEQMEMLRLFGIEAADNKIVNKIKRDALREDFEL